MGHFFETYVGWFDHTYVRRFRLAVEVNEKLAESKLPGAFFSKNTSAFEYLIYYWTCETKPPF